MSKHNFFAGPAIIAREVIEEAASAALDFDNMGLSLLEISHRTKNVVDFMDESFSLVKELLSLTSDQEVLFLTGGASSQFFMSAMNLLPKNETAGYVDTGAWSTKAIKEAKLMGNIEVLTSSKDQNYSYIPKGYNIPNHLRYLHLTSNNTIFGTQYQEWPDSEVPYVCDMSSDIFSRRFDASKFDLIYAGAQKNLGPSGTTLVIVNKEALGKVERQIPTMLNYQTHIDKKSAFNTQPVFPIYVCLLTLRWLKKNGGVEGAEQRNKKKADLLYNCIDHNELFKGTAKKEDRSLMNVCFVLNDNSLDDKFMEMATDAGCVGLKGHRSVGGFRASIYNALPYSSVEVLVNVMEEFQEKYG
jgi:phosphoserine aminotransferase